MNTTKIVTGGGGGGIFGVEWEPPLEEACPIDRCTAFTTEK